MKRKGTLFLIIEDNVVELERIELSSKQGSPTLSTRLFRPLVFEHQQDPDHRLMP